MLENMYSLFQQKIQNKRKAWDYFIELLAVDNRASIIFEIGHKFEWLFNDDGLVKKTLDIYDDDLLTLDYHDHLGDMYLHHIVPKSEQLEKARYIMQRPEASIIEELISPVSKDIMKLFDPIAGTGRLLIAAHKSAPQARCFGVEKDLDLYRIALTNFAIHSIPGYLLHADTSYHEVDISSPLGKANWNFANHWNPTTNLLKPATKKFNHPMSN